MPIIIMATKRTSAAIRYNLMLCLFAVFLLVTAGTFVYVLGDARQSTGSQNVISSYYSANTSTIVKISDSDDSLYNSFKTFTDIVGNYFNQHYILIVSIWFVLFLLKVLYMAGNMVYMQRVRRFNVFKPSVVWQDKLTSLCEKLQIKKAVLLLESGYLKTPVVIGYFKPVILIPVGMLAGIAPAQIEAVLLHELAHIRRSDNFVNFLQHLAEAVFFFNPGLLWISHLLREERENCCDDMAIAQTNSKEDFVKALISFKEHSINYPLGALAFSGRKSSLLNRVMRIVYQENKTFSVKESSVFLVAVAMVTLMAFTFYPAKDVKQQKEISFNRIPHKLQAKSVVYVPVHPKPDVNTGNVAKRQAVKSLTGKDDVAIIPPADTVSPISNSVIAGGGAARVVGTRGLIEKATFSNDKFYSRQSLGNGEDFVQVLAPGTQMKATLPHNAKVAIIVNDVLYDESDVAEFAPAQVESRPGHLNSISGGSIERAKMLYPDLDLSKYSAYVIIGSNATLASMQQTAYSP